MTHHVSAHLRTVQQSVSFGMSDHVPPRRRTLAAACGRPEPYGRLRSHPSIGLAISYLIWLQEREPSKFECLGLRRYGTATGNSNSTVVSTVSS